ncbi:TetR/AcrR family transcriptional regulator [Rhodovibrionaceae bacterium A322]
MRKNNARERLLDAAETVILEEGLLKLTLDNVAKAGEVSKGGLIYHFASKEALLRAMVERQVARWESSLEQHEKDVADSAGAAVETYARACDAETQRNGALWAAMIAAFAMAPDLIDPLRQSYERHLQRLRDSNGDFARLAALSLASDGLWMLELFGLPPLSKEERRGILLEIITLARETEPAVSQV